MINNPASRLDENALLHPDKPAFIFKQKNHAWASLSYRQFLDMETCLQKGLIALGLAAHTRAVLMAPPDISFFALTFAMLKTGITPVIIDPAIGFRNVTSCLDETQPQIFIGNALSHSLRFVYGWGRSSIKKNLTIGAIMRAGLNAPDQEIRTVEDTAEAAIIFTSGSTGLPRGAIYTPGNLLAQMEMLVNALGLTGHEVDLPAFPIFAMIDLLLGVTAVVPDIRFPRPSSVNPELMIEAVQNYHVDTLFASPVVLDRIAQYAEIHPVRLASLKRIITAGAPAPVPVLESFMKCLDPEAKIYGIYGSTEALPIALVDCQEILKDTRFASNSGAGICVGRPVEGINVQIIPISDAPLDAGATEETLLPGITGEILVEGRSVTAAYAGSAEHTHLAKIQELSGGVRHRMGDLGYFDQHGRLWYCGRKSHRVNTPNGSLFSERVEGIFNAHLDVYRTALVGVNLNGLVRPVLWVELKKKNTPGSREKVRQDLLSMGSRYEMTREIKDILFYRTFPTDVRHNSKIIREKLAEIAQKRLK